MPKLPLTEKGEAGLESWGQSEYVACMARGYGFAAHGHPVRPMQRFWLYKLGPTEFVVLRVTPGGSEVLRHYEKRALGLDWIDTLRRELPQED